MLTLPERDAIRRLRAVSTIRERCENIFEAGLEGDLEHFSMDLERLPDLAERVAAVTRRNYPSLEVPLHSRWRHFDAGGDSRLAGLDGLLSSRGVSERARIQVDLVVVSVLLDAGAGRDWKYREQGSDRDFRRSEGLAVASFHMFLSGFFSSSALDPLRVDADRLESLGEEALARELQVSEGNRLTGVTGRVELLRALAAAMRAHPEIFGEDHARVGNCFDYFVRLCKIAGTETLSVETILRTVLESLEDVWPNGLKLLGVNLGDVGRHPRAGGEGSSEGLVPFHKLSQWLTYSLIEPLQEAGVPIQDIEKLTGLPEYRNGGLFVDGGVLRPRRKAILEEEHGVESEVIVEWRALTVALLDRLRDVLAEELGLSPADFPLAKVLQGGAWETGRELASEFRDGSPPIKIRSDGTVF